MNVENWTEADKLNYELAKIKEAYRELENKSIYDRGFLKGAQEEAIKSEIKQLKMLKKMEADGVLIPPECYDISQHKDQIINYFNTHPNYAEETESQILGNLDLDIE